MVGKYITERGDFVFINFNPQSGHEQAGFRPALVLSPKSYNSKTGLCLACPITNNKKGYPFEVDCFSEEVSGVILADQVKCLDWNKRVVKFKAKASSGVVTETLAKLGLLLKI